MALVPAAAQAQTTGTTSTTKTDILSEGSSKNTQTGLGSAANGQSVNADGTTVGDSDGTVVVTGSRIRRQSYDTVAPTLVTDRQYVDERNFTNVADALNNLPGIRGSVTPNGAQGSFGQGVNFTNLYGLGSNRTLTLINGRRVVSSNPNTLFNQGTAGSQVDTNIVQTILLDHAETTTIVGATTYGSDAIGGTVNFILRDRYNGVTVNGLTGITERGDGFRYNAAVLVGHDFLGGKLNVTAAYTRDVQNGILYSDRDFLTAGVGTVTNPSTAGAATLGRTAASGITFRNDGRVNTGFGYNDSTTDGNPGSLLVRDRVLYQLTTGGEITDASRATAFTSANRVAAAVNGYQFDTTGNLVPLNKGVLFAAPYASGGDGYRLYPYSQVTSDVKRHTGNLFVHYDASDALKFFFEGTYYNARGDQLVAQPTYNSTLFGGNSAQLTFSATNPFLTSQAKAQLATLGVNTFQLSRASDDLADQSGGTKLELYRAVLGARGDVKLFGRPFNYEAYGNYGRTRLDDFGQSLNQQKFVNAVNVTTNAAGQIVCNPTPTVNAVAGYTPTVDAACAPLNLFGKGSPSAAARAYIIQNTHTISVLQQKDFVANFGGSPFALFGNDYSFNIGYEHREEDGRFTPDSFQQAGLGRSVAIAPINGRYNVDEEYGEVLLPLLRPSNHVPLLNLVEIDASVRHVDNTVNGGFIAWSGGGRWKPVQDITLRADYTRSFRAPAITELFLPRSSSFVTVPDLCSTNNINAGAAPVIRARNCAAFLAAYPNATPLDAASATVPAVSGGNPMLKNEVSYSYTFGGSFTPRFLKRFSIGADYINVVIRNPITNLTVTQIASACFDNATFNTADPANGNSFCSQIKRYAPGQGGNATNGGDRGGQVTADPANPGVSSGYVNGNRIAFSGIQGTISYSQPLDRYIPGRFETDNTIFSLNKRLIDTTGVAPQRTDGTFLGTGSLSPDPKFQFRSDNRIVVPGVGGFATSVNFVGKQSAVRTALSTDLREINTLDAYATVDMSLWIEVQKKYRLTISVTNVGDKKYQDYDGYYNPNSAIDLFGRRFAISVRGQL
ncbi:TonB-dependent receptor domain-containing protein [Sphingomonas bacterium]|uniref:TonB-dependent receptor domain-containing protein n=1 Tax=Sphingomonas bacterium TaxID=1895847 RepID=UPI001C2D7DFA|nr:TonB-dependent receptor [Sphingomonas bacterium]